MDYINKLLDKCKKVRSLRTDLALSELLKVKKQTLSGWRHGDRLPDPVACAQIAQITGEPLAKILGTVGEARAISSDEKKVWRKLAQVAVLIICAMPITSVLAAGMGSTSRNHPSMYIMSGMRRWYGIGSRYLRMNHGRFTSMSPLGRTSFAHC